MTADTEQRMADFLANHRPGQHGAHEYSLERYGLDPAERRGAVRTLGRALRDRGAMNESTPLADQVALVTGAGRGIGRAIAIAYARAGARVVVASRTATELDALVAEIEAVGGAATAVPTDVTSVDAVEHLFARIDELGGLDVVMLNAGGLPGRGPVADSDVAVWNDTLALNLTAAYLCARAAIPRLRARAAAARSSSSVRASVTVACRSSRRTCAPRPGSGCSRACWRRNCRLMRSP